MSAGWQGKVLSIVNFLRVVQIAQDWAAKNVQRKCLTLGFALARILNQPCHDLRLQFTLNMSLTPLQRNSTRTDVKKIVSTFSGCPHMTQFPVEGPFLRWIWLLEGNLPLANCQVQILIFKGIFGFQISSKNCTGWLAQYMDLVEKMLEGSNFQESMSLFGANGADLRTSPNCCHCLSSSGPKFLQNWTLQPLEVHLPPTDLSRSIPRSEDQG
jgi:hypothetical protein